MLVERSVGFVSYSESLHSTVLEYIPGDEHLSLFQYRISCLKEKTGKMSGNSNDREDDGTH